MRVIFFGTSPFAVPTLQALHDSAHTVLAVVTQPDRPAGRGMQLAESAVKKAARALGYETVLQPERVRRKPFPEELAALEPDALVVVSFGQIIPQRVLDIPRHGGINVHASLLPRWRGAAPIHRAIMAGDTETGVATMRMEATLDTGPVFLEARLPITPDDTTLLLEPRLAEAGALLLVQTLDRLEQEPGWEPTPQREEGMTYATMLTREDGFLDPTAESAALLANRVRALTPRPAGVLLLVGKEVKVLEAQVLQGEEQDVPGTVVALTKAGIELATLAGRLRLVTVQPVGKPVMAAAAYANGARLRLGDLASRP
ncbi:methionyl-tRNA formyltransferase [Armatimonas rosea]|uniref:Methionyl-tRNA formyltransferase n=1 Tax=Armatimonas rosea TaxID=685828 RepID=A0A7W9SL84_ARMRO|nr:methionyl-tRNA formyltransferase [Armatimonas rosea]MBB6048702.1 methionyl-tRNA formyltransferase [Armatimonas rosea]